MMKNNKVWVEKRIKFVASYNDEALPENTEPDFEIDYIEISDVDHVNGMSNSQNLLFEKAPSRARRIVREGDTIVSTVRTYLKSIAHIDEKYNNSIVSTGFAVIRPKNDKEINPKYLGYCFQDKRLIGDIVSHSVGVSYPAINASALVSLYIKHPSFSEQTQIASFLDQKTAQIDKLIAQKEKLLKLLAEKRTAIITQAVTKGLDPNVEMKDSGIDWFGKIPKHWGVKPLKFVVKLINEKLNELGYLPYMGLEHIESWTTKRIIDENAKAEGVVSKFKPNDVLFGKLRPYLAKVYLCDFEGGASTEALVLRSGNEVIPEFLKFYLVSDLIIDVINSSTYGSKMPRASWNFIGKLPMILPSPEIQTEIANYLSDKIEKFDNSIYKIRDSINQLKEYREALITAAVTGQIDVRKEASHE